MTIRFILLLQLVSSWYKKSLQTISLILFSIEIYEKREGAESLTMPQFFSFYKRVYKDIRYTTIRDVTRPFYPQPLPEYVKCSRKLTYKLINDKPLFWRTFNQSEMNGESFYYQQIVLKLPIFHITYQDEMSRFGTFKG